MLMGGILTACDPESWCGDDFEINAFIATIVLILVTTLFAKKKPY